MQKVGKTVVRQQGQSSDNGQVQLHNLQWPEGQTGCAICSNHSGIFAHFISFKRCLWPCPARACPVCVRCFMGHCHKCCGSRKRFQAADEPVTTKMLSFAAECMNDFLLCRLFFNWNLDKRCFTLNTCTRYQHEASCAVICLYGAKLNADLWAPPWLVTFVAMWWKDFAPVGAKRL